MNWWLGSPLRNCRPHIGQCAPFDQMRYLLGILQNSDDWRKIDPTVGEQTGIGFVETEKFLNRPLTFFIEWGTLYLYKKLYLNSGGVENAECSQLFDHP